MSPLQQVSAWVKDLVGEEYLYFDRVLTARTNVQSYPFEAWGVCSGPKGEVFVMDSDGQWWPVDEGRTDEKIVAALHDRMQSYYHKIKNNKEAAWTR